MNNMNTERSYSVEFNEPKYNATYTFKRSKSASFNYGNGSYVAVFKDGTFKDGCDTRYDSIVMKDFDAWCDAELNSMFNPDFEPHWTLIDKK